MQEVAFPCYVKKWSRKPCRERRKPFLNTRQQWFEFRPEKRPLVGLVRALEVQFWASEQNKVCVKHT